MPGKFYVSEGSLIRVEGSEAIDYLNRMSTNDLRNFQEGKRIRTVLTSDKGRIVDVIDIFNSKFGVYLSASPENSSKVILHLEKYAVTDDVSFVPVDADYSLITIITDDPGAFAAKLTGGTLDYDEVNADAEAEFIFQDDSRLGGIRILCRKENESHYRNFLGDMKELSRIDFEKIRIASGTPAAPGEFSEDINPMECGLTDLISFNKGCYIGQEVIARLDSQSKLPKQMVRIESESSLSAGSKVYNESGECGFVASCIFDNGKSTALGFVRSTMLDFGGEYFCDEYGNKLTIRIYKIN